MKKALSMLTVAAVLAAGGAALAGDCGSEGGFNCQNMCPLAKKADARRSYGAEGSAARQAALAAQVVKGLAKV
jgi:hypothetical protein